MIGLAGIIAEHTYLERSSMCSCQLGQDSAPGWDRAQYGLHISQLLAESLEQSCFEPVGRGGRMMPCGNDAVASYRDAAGWYPVCAEHTRAPARPLLLEATPRRRRRVTGG